VRPLSLVALVSIAVAVVVVLTRDPEEAWAVGAVILASAVAAGAIATVLQLRGPRGGRRRAGTGTSVAARRGLEIGVIVALLLWLRAVDGLSILTGTFVVVSFAVAEAILSARPQASR